MSGMGRELNAEDWGDAYYIAGENSPSTNVPRSTDNHVFPVTINDLVSLPSDQENIIVGKAHFTTVFTFALLLFGILEEKRWGKVRISEETEDTVKHDHSLICVCKYALLSLIFLCSKSFCVHQDLELEKGSGLKSSFRFFSNAMITDLMHPSTGHLRFTISRMTVAAFKSVSGYTHCGTFHLISTNFDGCSILYPLVG